MALIKRKGFGQVEPNHLSAQRTGQIYAQLPADEAMEILENGQYVKYDYAKGTAFSSYLESVTKLAILHEYQLKGIPNEFKPVSENGEVAKYGNKYLLMTVAGARESPISNNKFRRADEGESHLLDYIPDNSSEEKIELFLSNEEIEDIFERILNTKRNKPFKNAFIDYMNGKTQLQISEKYGFSQSYLSRRLNIIVKEIKNYYLQLI